MRGSRKLTAIALVVASGVASAVTSVAAPSLAAPGLQTPGHTSLNRDPSRFARTHAIRLQDRGPATVERYAEFDTSFIVPPIAGVTNVFDPTQIDVRAALRSPNGTQHAAIAFWYQEYSRALVGGYEHLTAIGTGAWKFRFTPNLVGAWSWHIEVRTTSGQIQSTDSILNVTPSKRSGFVRRSTHDPRYLAFDNGSPYFAIGENTGWYDGGGTFDYDRWFAKLHAQGATFARLWMPSWAFGIEWNDTGLGDYSRRLDRAWQLDYVLKLAEKYSIHVMLSLLNHGAFSTAFNSEWAQNPYNVANGGPLTAPEQVFTDPAAERILQQRIRYVVARWGASAAITNWELWNEVDLVDNFNEPIVAAWHKRMVDYIHSIDPAKHLISTSMAFPYANAELFPDAGLDIAQLHFYAGNGVFTLFPDLGRDVIDWTRERASDTKLPTLFGELGVDSRGPAETMAADRDGKGMHDGLWAGVVSGGIGTAMPWWWDNLIDTQPDRYYPMFGVVARFVRDVRWDREHFAFSTATTNSSEFTIDGLQGERTGLYWIRDTTDTWDARHPRIAGNVVVTINDPRLARGWCATWYDTWRGSVTSTQRIRATELVVPAFRRDLALRVSRCP